MVQLTDTLDADMTARICADGSLVADVRAARVGIQTYLRAETDAPETFTGDMVRVYRPESEVFSRDSMASFAAAPFTIDHPTTPVDATNWRDLGVGEVNGDVVRDGGFVRVPVIVRDAAAVEKVRTTHKQLSMGYSCSLDWAPGTTPDGQAYDAVQRDIKINHLAAVRAARGGPELKISDERPKETTMKIKIGDAEVDATNGEAVRVAVDALNLKLSTSAAALTASDARVAELTTTLTTKDAEVVTLTQQLADAALTPAKLQDAAKVFADTHTKAKALGVTVAADADIPVVQKAVVDAKVGELAKDWSPEQIAVSFTTLTKDTKADANDGVTPIGAPVIIGDAEQRLADVQRKASEARRNAWKTPATAAA